MTPDDIQKLIKEKDVAYVDVRFTDMRGKMQHVTFDLVAGRRGVPHRRDHVRRLLDRRLEGDQRERHEAAARPGHGLYRPVLPADHAGLVLRRAEPRHRRALQPRPPLDRQEGADLRPVLGRRRHGLLRARRRSSSCSTTCAGPPARTNTGYAFDSVELPANTGQDLSRGQHGPPARAQGRLLPGQPGRLRPGPARRDAAGDGRAGPGAGEAPPRGGPRPSTSWA